jgi:PAS domain S-box-containing protein
VLLTDQNGLIFCANRPEWVFRTLRRLTPEQRDRLTASRQFGAGPWESIGLDQARNNVVRDASGSKHLHYEMELERYPGFKVVYLRSLEALPSGVFLPLLRGTGLVVVALCLLTGISVAYLYRKASVDIVRRKEVEEELRRSEERYRSLYHNTPALLHSIDESSRFVSVSDYWLEALGYSREEVIGRKLTDFMTAESRSMAEETVIPAFFRTGVCKEIPYQFVCKDGRVIDVLLSAILERDRDGGIVRSLAVLVDITQRRRAEEQLRAAKEQLSDYSKNLEHQVEERTREITSILRHTPAVVYTKDPLGRYLMVNTQFEELFGIAETEVIGKTVRDVFPPQLAAQFEENERQVVLGGLPIQVEETVPSESGPKTYLTSIFPISSGSGRLERICGIAVDVTDLKRTRDQLRRLSAGIMESNELERAAIARELHDELGQVLTALRLDAAWLRGRFGASDEKGMQRADAMCGLIDQTISGVRTIATRLRPVILDDLGLADALEWYTTDFERRTSVACTFTIRGVPGLVDKSVATAVYRIVQEALTNVARHALATQVEVDLSIDEREVVVCVTDNGKGFHSAAEQDAGSLGLVGMRERAWLLGGTLAISSRTGSGTTARCTIPLPQPTEHAIQ